jgi:hypothetical protein
MDIGMYTNPKMSYRDNLIKGWLKWIKNCKGKWLLTKG